MKVLGCWVLLAVSAIAMPAGVVAQAAPDGDRVMAVVRAALAPALPFPDTDDSGYSPASGSPEPLWMVRPWLPGERAIEVLANPLNEINQAQAARAMAQIGAAINVAQRRSELQYERAIAEAKRTGRSQDVDGVTLSDEGIAGARIDAEAQVTIGVEFNQSSYSAAIESSVTPALSRTVAIGGAVAVVAVPSNTYQHKTDDRTEERFCTGETMVYFGALAPPEIRERSEHVFEVTTSASAAEGSGAIRSVAIRLRGNEALIAEIVAKTDWKQLLELLK